MTSFKDYIKELAMKKGTNIKPPKYIPDRKYEQEIILEDGLIFFFKAFYFQSADVWDIQFQDQFGAVVKSKKREGASIELFAALESVFKEFVEKTVPNRFRFGADRDEESRVKLYNMLARKIAKRGKFDHKITKSPINVNYWFKHWSVEKYAEGI